MIIDYIRLARPKEWMKSIFTFLPVPFALASGAKLYPFSFLLGILAFCLAASAVYAINDAQDAERDRLHDTKRNRPVASGRVSVTGARIWSVSLAAAAMGLAAASGRMPALYLTVVYIATNTFYTFVGKHIPLVDVFLLSSFYVMRVLLGTVLLGVVASNWMLLCACSVALFVGFAKRRSDFTKGLDKNHRPALMGYTDMFLNHAMAITVAVTLLAYAVYSMESDVLLPGRQFVAVPFVAFVLLDYLRRCYVEGGGGSPVEMVLKGPGLIVAFAGWLVATIWSLRIQW